VKTVRLVSTNISGHTPQLNPDEQVRAHVKRQVSRRLVQNSDDMKRLARGALRRIQKLLELVKSFASPNANMRHSEIAF
jgi:hypothetical protein